MKFFGERLGVDPSWTIDQLVGQTLTSEQVAIHSLREMFRSLRILIGSQTNHQKAVRPIFDMISALYNLLAWVSHGAAMEAEQHLYKVAEELFMEREKASRKTVTMNMFKARLYQNMRRADRDIAKRALSLQNDLLWNERFKGLRLEAEPTPKRIRRRGITFTAAELEEAKKKTTSWKTMGKLLGVSEWKVKSMWKEYLYLNNRPDPGKF